MRRSIHIAGIAALALASSMVVVLLLRKRSTSSLDDLTAPIVGGLLVGFGTFIGCRWAPPNQRSTRLAGALGVIYFLLGVVLTVPHKTHAVKMDLPVAGTGSSLIGESVEVALGLIAAFTLVLFPTLLARGIAALCKGMSRDDP
jgi:hypothetical protein